MRLTPLLLTIGIVLFAALHCRAAEEDVQLPEHLRLVTADDVKGLSQIAEWAFDDHPRIAAGAYRLVLQSNPDHKLAYRKLFELETRIELPDQQVKVDAALADIEAIVGHAFQVHKTDHFYILYDCEDDFMRRRAGALEMTHDAYFESLKKAGFRPLPLRERMICVLFKNHDDYARYAEQVDGEELSWSSGYYSSINNRIAFFRDRSGPRLQELTDQIKKFTEEIETLDVNAEQARRDGRTKDRRAFLDRIKEARQKLKFATNRRRALAAGGNDAKTIHEAIHQLAFNTGLQNPDVGYPFWLTEGLATNFEATDTDRKLSPYAKNRARLLALHASLRAGRQVDFDEFIVLRRLPSGANQKELGDLYSHAWGLFHFLYRKKQDELVKYMNTLAALPRGEPTPTQLHDAFADAFGDVDRINRHYLEFMKQIR